MLRLLALLLVTAAAVLPATAHADLTGLPAGFVDRTIASGLTMPIDAQFAPDGRLFVVEKAGRLRVVRPDGTLVADPVIDLSAQVHDYLDRGMLGLALARDFATTGHVYLVYVHDKAGLAPDASRSSRLVRVTVNASNQGSGLVTLLGAGAKADDSCPPPGPAVDCIPADSDTHTIGTVIAAPDGSIWLGTGDGAGYNDEDPRAFRALEDNSLAGKILRVDGQGRGLAGHPFCPGESDLTKACTKVFAKGFRNPFRFTLRPSGTLFVGDVGWGTVEELNFPVAGGSYGWPCREGTSWAYGAVSTCAGYEAANPFLPPQFMYPHEGKGASIMAGPEYTGSGYPSAYRQSLFWADYSRGWLRRLVPPSYTTAEIFASDFLGGVDLGLAPNGDLTYVSAGDGQPGTGSVHQISYVPANRAPTAAFVATPSTGAVGTTVGFDASGSADPDGDALTYSWQVADGVTKSGKVVSHKYTTRGSYEVRLTVSDGRSLSASTTRWVDIANTPPQLVGLAVPPNVRAGAQVTLTGTATDTTDGALPVDWYVTLVHGTHDHQLSKLTDTDRDGKTTFQAPDDHDADTYYRIVARVTDSDGRSTASAPFTVAQQAVALTIRSEPAGAPVTYSGVQYPVVSQSAAVGYRTSLSVPETFAADGITYRFDRWSDGGARSHALTIPDRALELVAIYARDGGGIVDVPPVLPPTPEPPRTPVTPTTPKRPVTTLPKAGAKTTTAARVTLKVDDPFAGRRTSTRRLTGRLTGGSLSGRSAQVALGRRDGQRCRWWSRSTRRFGARSSCTRPTSWNTVRTRTVEGGRAWSLDLGAAVPKARYLVLSRTVSRRS